MLDLEGIDAREIRTIEDGVVRQIRPGVEEIRLRPNQMVTRRLPEEAVRVEPLPEEAAATDTEEDRPGISDSVRWALPYQILGVDEEGKAFELRPLLEVDGGGLRPQRGGGFLGRIFAAVADAGRPGPHPLETPIEILVTAEVDEVEPRQISIARTNSFSEVSLRATSPRDPVRVRIVPSFDSAGTEIEVPVLRGQLQVSISPGEIPGLGLQTARVLVQAIGLPSAEGVGVALSSNRGSLEESTLLLDATGIASTTVRSVSTGVATIGASAGGLASGEATVRFVFPWLFLAAAVLGGGVGSLIRWGRTEPAARRSLWLELLVLGVLVGLVVASAYSIGINLLGLEPAARAGEALVFVLAALGAYFGIPGRSSAKA